MNGLVIEGGGRRGIFAAGVLDCLMENDIKFEYVSGVSSGAQAALDFVSGQIKRTKDVIIPADEGWTGVGFKKMFACDIDKIAYEYPYNQLPFDFDAFFGSGIHTEIVVTDCTTGGPEYICVENDEKLLLDALKASCSLPIIYQPVKIGEKEYIDGSIADAIPFERAMKYGCSRVLVVLSKPVTEAATDYSRYKYVLKRLFGKYPELLEKLSNRLERYNAQAKRLEDAAADGKVMVLRPDETYVGSFEMNTEKLNNTYDIGYLSAQNKLDDIKAFLNISGTSSPNP